MVATPFSQTLARLRELAGLTQLQLASRSNCAHSSVNRWERGGSLPKLDNAIRLDDALEADNELMAAWRRSTTGNSLPTWMRSLASIEQAALSVMIASPVLAPGYLQCERYARLAFTAGQPLASPEEIDRLVALRCNRLSELPDLRVTAVFPITALTAFPEDVRKAQVAHLLALIDSGRVTVHLVPEGSVLVGITSPLMIFRLRSGDLAATSDHEAGTVLCETDTYDRLQSLATGALAASLPASLSEQHLRSLQ